MKIGDRVLGSATAARDEIGDAIYVIDNALVHDKKLKDARLHLNRARRNIDDALQLVETCELRHASDGVRYGTTHREAVDEASDGIGGEQK